MKKLVATVLTILTCGAAYALPLGNPSEPSLFSNGVWCETSCCDPCDPCFDWFDAWSLRIGFYGDYVFNRHMEVDADDVEDRDILRTTIYTSAGYFAFNICDRIDLFTTLGATTLHINTNGLVFDDATLAEIDIGFETHFSWSLGARATLWERNCFALGIEGQYFQTKPHFNYLNNYANGVVAHLNDLVVTYREWQVGLGASYRFATSCPTIAFIPYAGVKYARSKLDMDETVFGPFTLHNLKAKKPWGYAIGISMTLCDMIGVSVEGRFAGEKGLYVNGQFRF